ncbi:MAG: glycosyltransferase family 1 protein [Candidatus Moranbacteria bacterium]|nr:glycosyltransferase family 1 protein [Candidatus Moranbacteria bacterium]
MLIGIDASRAFLRRRTGIEEYAYQTIKYLCSVISGKDTVVLYIRKKLEVENWKLKIRTPEIDFEVPKNWEVRGIWAPRFWTQIGLSLEMLWRAPDVLFIPAHTVPLVHPKKTIVTIHGLEYEFCKKGYAWWERLYMHFSIRYSCRVASTVVCVSENTKRDVMKLYGVAEEKIKVIYEGYSTCHSERSEEPRNIQESDTKDGIPRQARDDVKKPYLLFTGRLETRKNIVRIIEAFEILKEKYCIPHQLVLVGKPGYGYERIKYQVSSIKYKSDVIELGYVSEGEKWELLKNADVFLFPTLYEGFGLPVLEAQSVGVPVVVSSISSLPEVAGSGAVLVDPLSVESIAEGIEKVLSDKGLRDDIIEKGLKNVGRFSWQKCAEEIVELLQK